MDAKDRLEMLRSLECLADVLDEKFIDCKKCSYYDGHNCDTRKIAKDVLVVMSQTETTIETFKNVAAEHIKGSKHFAKQNYELNTQLKEARGKIDILEDITRTYQAALTISDKDCTHTKKNSKKEQVLPGTITTVLELTLLKGSSCDSDTERVLNNAVKLLLNQDMQNTLLKSQVLTLKGEVFQLKRSLGGFEDSLTAEDAIKNFQEAARMVSEGIEDPEKLLGLTIGPTQSL